MPKSKWSKSKCKSKWRMMGLNKVHCFGFLGVFAVVSGIVAFSAYDSLYSYIMKMVSN